MNNRKKMGSGRKNVWNIRRHMNNLPLKEKLLGIMLLGLSVMAVMSFVIIQLLSASYNRMLDETISESLSYSEREITNYMKKMEDLTEIFLSDSEVQKSMAVLKDSAERGSLSVTQLRNIGNYIGEYYQNYSDGILKYISLYTPVQTLKTNLIAADKLPEEVQEKILERSDKKDGGVCWVPDEMNEYGLFLARNIRRIELLQLDTLGTMVLNIDMNALVRKCTNFDERYGETAYVIARDDQILFHTNNLELGNPDLLKFYDAEKYKIEKIGDTQYFISHGQIAKYGWDYYCFVSYEQIAGQIRRIQNICLWIILLDVLGISWLTTTLIKRLVVHISSLKDRMQRFALDNTRVPESDCDYSAWKEEIGTLNRQFDEMSRTIIDLIQENYVNELLKKEAQLKALENQINPHFLYNTLDSIKWRAKAIGDQDISDMVEALGVLLRTSLRKKDEENYNIGREMEIVSSYVTIQKFRYEERLIFENCIRREWGRFEIPKLVIQPLLENAIFYGLERNVEDCKIVLCGKLENDKLHFYVKNTGSEFEEDLLEKLERGEIQPHGHGVGLLNIDKRIKIQYGKEYGLRLYNEEDYAVAELVIPVRAETGGTYAEISNRG